MAEPEQAAIGTFLSSIGSQLERGQRDKKRKHEQWMACIMGGNSAEACSQILGYDPGETGRAGAETLQTEAAGRKEAEIQRKLKVQRDKEARAETAAKTKFAREEGARHTEMPVEEAAKIDAPVDWTRALIRPEGATTAVKMTPAQIAEAKWKRGGPERDKAKRKEVAQEKREYELWKQKQGIGEGEPKGPVDTKYILKQASKSAGLTGRPMYDTPRKIDKMVRMWGKHNELEGVDDMAMENAFAALGLPTMADRGGLKEDLKSQPTDKEREEVLAEMGYDEKTVTWIMESYLRW